MNTALFAVALRYNALYIPSPITAPSAKPMSESLNDFLGAIGGLGYTVDEKLLHALEHLPADMLRDMAAEAARLSHTDLNWTPLVKGWLTPTGETIGDHIVTSVANSLPENLRGPGTTLHCGHFIPEGSFPIERYNGCPFCGQLFEHSSVIFTGRGSKRTVLTVWSDSDLNGLKERLMASPVPLDATQAESLKTLIKEYGIDNSSPTPAMKETALLCIDALTEAGLAREAIRYISSPADILRYLWYKKTGLPHIVRPATLVERAKASTGYQWLPDYTERAADAAKIKKAELRLKYDRKTCRTVADWLETVQMPTEAMCEAMHPYRGMWVRAIRALRLAEYSRRPAHPKLRELIDRFYRSDYDVWAGGLEAEMLAGESAKALKRLKERPGVFARSLFAAMLRLGSPETLAAFAEISTKVPLRLILPLASYAESYFRSDTSRGVHLPGGRVVNIPANPLTANYTAKQLKEMAEAVRKTALETAAAHFAAQTAQGSSIYIDPALFNIPVPVGDRSETVHDKAGALQGQRFKVDGDHVRLFMEWGRGLPAAHIDMDLSCKIIYPDHEEDCAYYSLTVGGATHSGDIQRIPDNVGAAEYIELDIAELKRLGAKYAAFTCNAYTDGNLSLNMLVGWMDSAYPMAVSDDTGVAYDPSTVAKAVSIASPNLAKGLLFGLLDVQAREIIWLEMAFNGQTIGSLNIKNVKALLDKLSAKISIGELLLVKAKAQGLTEVAAPAIADEAYTAASALDTTLISSLLN